MKKSKKILLFGNERIATSTETKALIFEYLMKNYAVVGLVISEKNDSEELEVVKLAKANNIKILNLKKLINSMEDLRLLDADIAVLIAYGKIIPQVIIDLFPLGILNIHPSLLPLHRGPTPIESVILNNELETGVSLMSLSKEMDSGPVFAQKKLSLKGTETKQEMANILDELALSIVKEKFDNILSETLKPKKQNSKRATYDKLLTKQDGIINWNESSISIMNKIRAFAGWPGTKTVLNNLNIKIISAEISDKKGNPGQFTIMDNNLYIYSSDSSLKIMELQPEGRKIMPIKDFLLGYLDKIS